MINKVSAMVYKCPLGDCTNGGLTSKIDSAVLYASFLDYMEDKEANPDTALIFREKEVRGKKYRYCVPFYVYGSHENYMAGGNLIYSSDSRFHFMSDYPLSVRDRTE